MRLAIMQPYFFPHLAYFQLMKEADEWIVFDEIQFIDKGWINRNRILHPNEEKQWQYFTLPLTGRKQFSRISELEIHPEKNWEAEIFGKLTHLKKKAPFYRDTLAFLEECFEEKTANLSVFLSHTLRKCAQKLEISTPIKVQSEMGMVGLQSTHPGQWAVSISAACGATEYINPLGGAEIFKKAEFDAANIKLKLLKGGQLSYTQRNRQFVPGLSIIDVLMWNSAEEVRELMTQYEVIEKDERLHT